MSKKDIDKFPSIDNVHEVLSDLTGLFDDRNKLLDTMFREDKYKEFLLAENMQQLAEADKRDDSANGRIKKDLANGYEVLKAKTTMQKFANFISPSSIPPMDLTSADDFTDDEATEEEEAPVEKEAPEKGEKGDKGDDGADGADAEVVKPDKPKPKSRVFSWQRQQTPKLKLAEGGAVSPSPMMNALNPSAQRPETKSGVKSLESLGLVGKKNVASELTEDLGLEEYKKALADAMALPLKAVAAGLAGLMDKVEVPGGEGAALEAQTSSVAKAFDVKAPKKKKENKLMNFVQGGGIVGALGRMFGGGRKKKQQTQTQVTQSSGTESSSQVLVAGEPYDPDNPTETQLAVLKMQEMMKGGPSLGAGGAEHPKLAPDQLSTQGDTKIDAMKNTISNITQGAKNMFMNTPQVRGIKAASGFITKLLGKVQPASEGSQYERQDINNLTNQVVMNNQSNMTEKTNMMINDEKTEGGRAAAARLKEIVAQMQQGSGVNKPTNTIAPTEIRVSKYLAHSLTTVHGGETPHDV